MARKLNPQNTQRPDQQMKNAKLRLSKETLRDLASPDAMAGKIKGGIVVRKSDIRRCP